MAEMTPRERVWAALNHQEPDRVPLDIGGGASTTVIEEGYENLKEHLGVKAEPRILNKIFRMARLDESVMQRLGSEFMPALDEGAFLYMPTTMPHASLGEALDVLLQRRAGEDGRQRGHRFGTADHLGYRTQWDSGSLGQWERHQQLRRRRDSLR